MIDINGYEISKAFTGGEPVNAIYSFGVKVWPVEPEPVVDWGGLTFTALEPGEIGMTHSGTNETTTKPSLSYSKNGSSWIEWDYTPIAVTTGDKVYFKGVNDKIGYSESDYSVIRTTGNSDLSGNIMSLLYGEDYEGKTTLAGKDFCFKNLFHTSKIVDASNLLLPSLDVPTQAYAHMLFKNTTLIAAPELPALSVGERGYWSLFQGTPITTYPYDLPAQTLADNSYRSMFSGCSELVSCGDILATNLSTYCFAYMFSSCTSLTTTPYLPAKTLANGSYQSMFSGCSKLNYVEADFLTEPSTTYTQNWLYGVASTGTFVANSTATWIESYTSGATTVPKYWTIGSRANYKRVDYIYGSYNSDNPACIWFCYDHQTATKDGVSAEIKIYNKDTTNITSYPIGITNSGVGSAQQILDYVSITKKGYPSYSHTVSTFRSESSYDVPDTTAQFSFILSDGGLSVNGIEVTSDGYDYKNFSGIMQVHLLESGSSFMTKGCAVFIAGVKLYCFGNEMNLIPALNTDSNKAGLVDLNSGIFYGHLKGSDAIRYGMI